MAKRATLKIQTNEIYTKYAGGYNGRYLFYFGGAGSGKSIDGYQRRLKQIITQSDGKHKFLYIRKVANTINDSIWKGTEQILKDWGLYSLCKFNKVEKSIVYEPNGNEIIMKGLDDPEKIKSIAGITGILIEEATELTKADFIQLDLRLRGITKYPKQIFVLFNPIDEDHWLWEMVEPQLKGQNKIPKSVQNVTYLQDNVWEFETVSEDGDSLRTRTINTNYKHNRFLDAAYIARLKSLASLSENDAIVYEHGRWGRMQKGLSYVYTFSEIKHVKNVEFRHDLPVHYTVDFNVSPYMSGLVMQFEYIQDGFWNGHSDYWQVNIIDEVALEHPHNNALDLGAEVEHRYNLDMGLFLYGDASGNNRTQIKDVPSVFAHLLDGLSVNPIKRIPRSNPRYAKIAPNSLGRAKFINFLFSGLLPLRLRISPKCSNFIKDLKYCVQGVNGRMDKKVRDGHHLDAFTYLVCHEDTFAYLALTNKK